MNILDLDWEEFYIAETPNASWYTGRDGHPDPIFIKPEYVGALTEFRSALLERNRTRKKSNQPFRIEWGVHKERVRVRPYLTFGIKPLFVCRRYRAKPGSLKELGFPNEMERWLIEKPHDPGMIIFFGKQKAGKTTAAGSFTRQYIERHTGRAFTVECPVEMELEGRHGNGHIFQTEIDSEEEMGPAVRTLLRSGATMIYPGEVTSDLAAREVQEIAGAGMTVVTTVHANDLLIGLRRFADAAGGNYDAFAERLNAAFFLQLEDIPSQAQNRAKTNSLGTPTPYNRRLIVSPLVIRPSNRTAMIAAMRKGDFQWLNTEVRNQRDTFMRGGMPI